MSRSARSLAAALLAGTTLLGGCAPLLMGGAVVGGSLLAIDRRTSGAQIDDQAIEVKSKNRIRTLLADRGHVDVVSYNRIVLITGEVPTEADKAAVGQAVGQVENVRSLVNELVASGASSWTGRSADAILTGRVKASLLDAGDALGNHVKVVCERGIVYLMGRVSASEADRASDVVRAIRGVQKVVRVFEVVSEDELPKPEQRSPG